MNLSKFGRARIISIAAATMMLFFNYAPAYAAISTISDTMTRQKISTASSHTITFTASGNIPANETIAIDFGEDSTYFTVDGTGTAIADLSVTNGAARTIVGVDGLCTGHSGNGDIAASVNDSTGVLTLTTCASYSATTAVFTVNYGTAAGGTNRVTNPSAKGTYIIPINISGGITESGKFAVSIPEASGDDQIPVSGTVNPSITFTVVNTTLALGDISTSAATWSGTNNVSVGTNAGGGYTITVQDQGSGSSDGLYDSVILQLIDSVSVDISSTNGYGGQCHKSSGDGACHANYPDTTGNTVGAFTRAPLTFASYGSKPSGTDTFQIRVGARVSASQAAGAYSDTLTLLATGNF